MRDNAIDRALRNLARRIQVAYWCVLIALSALRRRYNILRVTKDGGPESTVWAHWLFESKRFGSVVLLRFEDGSRDAYHTHAFNSVSWLLRGYLCEWRTQKSRPGNLDAVDDIYVYLPSAYPILTRRQHHHKVCSAGRSWVLSFRGPWAATWRETVPTAAGGTQDRVLAAGRVEVTL